MSGTLTLRGASAIRMKFLAGLVSLPNSLSIGTVATTAAGTSATATIGGAAPAQTLSLTVPKGDQGIPGPVGNTGAMASLAAGSVTTLAAGSAATATITGAVGSQVLNLGLPRGMDGSGAVTSVAGKTGAVTLVAADVSGALTAPVGNGSLANAAAGTVKANLTGAAAAPSDVTLANLASALAALGDGIPVRQTVLGGPSTSGLPSFLPATSASLSIAAQNVSGSTPLIVSAANGFSALGAVNVTNAYAAASWTGLTASTTCYLYVNVSTGAFGFTTLPPLYLDGATPTFTNGQFTFDTRAMVGYLGNGTIAAVTPIVFVGEVVTNASTVTSSAAYSYSGRFDSGWTATIPAALSVTAKIHNLGVNPDLIRHAEVVFQNITTDGLFSPGMTLGHPTTYQSASSLCLTVAPVLTRLGSYFACASDGWISLNVSSAAVFTLTPSKWQWKVIVGRGW